MDDPWENLLETAKKVHVANSKLQDFCPFPNDIKKQKVAINGFFMKLILFSAINRILSELSKDIDKVVMESGIKKADISTL